MDVNRAQLPSFLDKATADVMHATRVQMVDWRFVLNRQGRHHDVRSLQVAVIASAAREVIAAGAQRGFPYAVVPGLPKNWRPKYGGLLLVHDSAGHIERGLTRSFTVLNIFRVRHPRPVSEVASFAPAFRYTLTGWLKASAP